MLLVMKGCAEQRGSVQRPEEPEMWNWSASSGANILTNSYGIPSVKSEVITTEWPTSCGHKSVPGKESETEWRERPQFWTAGGSMTPIQPPVLWETGTVSLGLKRPKCETNRFLPSNVEVKNDYGHTIHLLPPPSPLYGMENRLLKNVSRGLPSMVHFLCAILNIADLIL
jgi:hypothetical protein